jgi:hypothetical protein
VPHPTPNEPNPSGRLQQQECAALAILVLGHVSISIKLDVSMNSVTRLPHEFQDSTQMPLDIWRVRLLRQPFELYDDLAYLRLIENRVTVRVNEAKAWKILRLKLRQEPCD